MRKLKKVLFFSLLYLAVSSNTLSRNYASQLSYINSQLPDLTYAETDSSYIKLSNGVMVEGKGGYRSAYLTDRILNADFNNDGHPDAAVIIHVIYEGIGYFSNIVFLVLYGKTKTPYVSNGVHIGIATYQIDLFSLDGEAKKIIVGYMSRLPGQPKAAAPTVPTVLYLSLDDKKLSLQEKSVEATCYFSFAPSSIFKPAVDCPARSVLKEGKCTPVSDLCDKFDKTTGKCQTCRQGFQLSQGECAAVKKSTPAQSLTCHLREVAKGGKCVPVSDQCKDWHPKSGDCTKCYGGYRLESGKCVP